MGKKSRTKGAEFEREIANLFRQHYPEARRGGHDQAGPAGAPDVSGTPWWIECKRYREVTQAIVADAMKQARAAADRADDPRPLLVVTRQDRKRARAHWVQRVVAPDTGASGQVVASAPLAAWLGAVT